MEDYTKKLKDQGLSNYQIFTSIMESVEKLELTRESFYYIAEDIGYPLSALEFLRDKFLNEGWILPTWVKDKIQSVLGDDCWRNLG